MEAARNRLFQLLAPIKKMTKDVLSRRGEQNRTKDAPIGKTSKAKRASGTNWKKLRSLSDAAIHKGIESDPDAHPSDEQFWKDAKIAWPTHKAVVTMRLYGDDSQF